MESAPAASLIQNSTTNAVVVMRAPDGETHEVLPPGLTRVNFSAPSVPASAPDGVYVKFIPEYPALDPSDNDWRNQTIRSEFAAYLTRLVAADLMTEDQGKYQTRAAADAELERLIERYHEGNGETRVRTGRFR